MAEAKIVDEFIGECLHPAEELKRIALSKNLDPNTLTFEVQNAFTYIKGKGEERFREADHNTLPQLKNKEFALDPDLKIQQKYAIKIKNKKDDPRLKLVVEFVSNPGISRITAIIKKESFFKYDPDLEHDILKEINTMKARRGLLVGIYEEEMKSKIVEMVNKIKHDGKLNEDYPILICEGFQAAPTIDSEVIYHYKNNNRRNKDEPASALHDEIYSVRKDDLVLEHIKPKKGTEGRNCKGEYISAVDPDSSILPSAVIDSSIRQEDNEKHTRYYANKSGYVIFENNTLRIEEELVMDQLSYATTGNIITDVHTGTKMRVTQSDTMSEAVGEGIKIEVGELIVEGNIGTGVEIRTLDCTIQGQTHGESKIYSDNVHVNIHKGYIRAQEASVERLENGHIHAEKAVINNLMGGTVKAREIIIKTLFSHARLFASEYIEIETLKGEENKIAIDPEAFFGDGNRIEDMMEEIEEISKELQTIEREIRLKITTIQKGSDAINAAKQRIAECKKSGTQPPAMLVQRVRQFSEIVQQTKKLKNAYQKKRDELKEEQQKINEISAMTLEAKITNLGSWIGHNEIKFVMLNPRRDFTYIPRGSERTLRLFENDDGTYTVKATA